MALRLKSHWHNDDVDRPLSEIAGVLAFNAWRIAVDRAISLHCQRFVYQDDAQRLAVIQEYLCFLIHLSDRLAHPQLEDDQRQELIIGLAKRLAEHLQDNSHDLLGPSDYVGPFFDRLNKRSREYAVLSFTDEGPSYPFLRHLGYSIQCLMGEGEENRWVIDQVMDKDGWETYCQLAQILGDLLDAGIVGASEVGA